MTTTPAGPPPSDLIDRLQKNSTRILRAALASPDVPQDRRILDCLAVALNLKARRSLESMGTEGLDGDHYLALRLAKKLAPSGNLSSTLVLDLIVAYPEAISTVHGIVEQCIKKNKGLVLDFEKKVIAPLFNILTAENRRIDPPTKQASRPADSDKRSQHPFARVSYTLLVLARAHHALAEAVLKTGSSLEILRASYAKIQQIDALSDVGKIHTKQTFLVLLHTILSTLQQTEREWKVVNMQEEDLRATRVLKDASLEQDYRFFFLDADKTEGEDAKKKPVFGEVEMDILRSLTMGDVNPTERGHAQEARIAPIKALFPHIPSYLLVSALSHPRFSAPPTGDADPAVEALTNAMLDGTLPSGCEKLRRAMGGDEAEAEEEASEEKEEPVDVEPVPTAKINKRQNIWDEMPMDFQKLKIENERREETLEAHYNNIPLHLREQILRLEEQQHEEAEAEQIAAQQERDERRLRAEAARLAVEGGKASRGVLQPPRTAAFEEELDEDEDSGGRVAMRGVMGDSEGSDDGEEVVAGYGGSDDEIVENLDEESDESYLEQLYMHNRDAFKRDAATRKSAKRAEMRSVTGWNDERLEDWARLMDRNPRKDQILGRHAYTRNHNDAPARDDSSNRGGRGRGRGGGEGGRGRGASNGSGRGRGGQNKGSRGHSNAARTRGHDRKMQKAAGWT